MKSTKYKFQVDVDAGQIMALIRDTATKNSFPIKKGKYKITLKVKESWDGPNKSHNFLLVKEDAFLCVDDGFYKDNNGEEAFENEELFKQGCAVSTGGDGGFEVEITLTPVKVLGKDPYKEILAKAKAFLKNKKYTEKFGSSFAKKFLTNCYYSSVNEMIQKKQNESMRDLLNNMDKMLAKIKKQKKA